MRIEAGGKWLFWDRNHGLLSGSDILKKTENDKWVKKEASQIMNYLLKMVRTRKIPDMIDFIYSGKLPRNYMNQVTERHEKHLPDEIYSAIQFCRTSGSSKKFYI